MDRAVAELAAKLASLERQIRTLATAARANFTDVRGGYTRWLLSNGSNTPSVRIGAAAGDADVGIWVNDDDGAVVGYFGTAGGKGGRLNLPNDDQSASALVIDGGKMYAPLISCAWQKDPAFTDYSASGYAVTADSAYERMWTALLPVTSGGIVSSVRVSFAVGGITADVRLRASAYPSGTPVVLTEEEFTSSGFLAGSPWTIPDTILDPAASPIGQLVMLEVHARVTAGGGSVFVAPDLPVANWVV